MVLLDFWTFCCVNCLHTIPLLHAIEQKFDSRLVVIGVHSPKFTHETDVEQLRNAVQRYGITHPVIHDPDRRLWEEYAIRAWPTLVLISGDGRIVGQYPGEPRTAELESVILKSLQGIELTGNTSNLEGASGEVNTDSSQYHYPSKISRFGSKPDTWAMTDTGSHQVVLLNNCGTEIDRFGSGQNGLADGAAAAARFDGPEGLCCSAPEIFVADTRNHSIRRINTESRHVTTFAGTGERGGPLPTYWSDGAHLALASPWDLELVGERIYFANAGTHQIGELRLLDGRVRLAAGNGREGIHDGPAHHAHLAQPSGLAYDAASELLYFVDSETSSIRTLDLRQKWVDSLVGHGLFVFGDADGTYDQTRLQHPLGIAICHDDVYVADTYNNSVKIVDPKRQVVSRLDNGDYTCVDDLCVPVAEPAGITCAGIHRLLVVDTNNHRVLEYDLEKRTSVTWSPAAALPVRQKSGAL